MKINLDKDIIEFIPENPLEIQSLEVLWRRLVDCANFNKRIVPIGEFLPDIKETVARFYIEDTKGGVTTYSSESSLEDADFYCAICNKYKKLKKGESIPFCCGKLMELID
jgi:hypothetical protein